MMFSQMDLRIGEYLGKRCGAYLEKGGGEVRGGVEDIEKPLEKKLRLWWEGVWSGEMPGKSRTKLMFGHRHVARGFLRLARFRRE
jgi:hypothetical protein